jgi:hypothetical protein
MHWGIIPSLTHYNPDLFSLEIDWHFAGASLLLTVSPPDFLNDGSHRNHDVGSPFCHFGKFFIFNSFKGTFQRD